MFGFQVVQEYYVHKSWARDAYWQQTSETFFFRDALKAHAQKLKLERIRASQPYCVLCPPRFRTKINEVSNGKFKISESESPFANDTKHDEVNKPDGGVLGYLGCGHANSRLYRGESAQPYTKPDEFFAAEPRQQEAQSTPPQSSVKPELPEVIKAKKLLGMCTDIFTDLFEVLDQPQEAGLAEKIKLEIFEKGTLNSAIEACVCERSTVDQLLNPNPCVTAGIAIMEMLYWRPVVYTNSNSSQEIAAQQ